jgi:hypothetical protein
VRNFGLPLIAVLLVALVLGVQLAAGGGEYAPRRSADPCAPRRIAPTGSSLEPLAERIVLLGLDGAACRLGISRERLVLSLADRRELDPRASAALKAGLRGAVDRLDREHRLPKVSALIPEALDEAELPGIVETVIRAVPDGVVDGALPTGPLLRRAVGELDVDQLLGQLDDPGRLESAIRSAILRAAADQIVDALKP